MSGISGRGEFADYRAIGIGVAIMPSVSVVIPAKNEARNLEHVFGTIPEWVSEIVLSMATRQTTPWRSRRSCTPPSGSFTSRDGAREMPFRRDSRRPRAKLSS